MLVLKENTAFILTFFDELVLLQSLSLQIIDAVLANPQTFLFMPVSPHNLCFVLRCTLIPDNRRQIQSQRVDMFVEQLPVFLVQRGHARIHIYIILRHTAR